MFCKVVILSLLVVAVIATVNAQEEKNDIVLDRQALAKLSETRMRVRTLDLANRCEWYEQELGKLLADQVSDKSQILRRVANLLERRTLPFGNSQPVLEDLKKCLGEDSKSDTEKESLKREVIAGPQQRKSLEEEEADQGGLDEALKEFKEVKNNVKDFGQDLYLDKENKKTIAQASSDVNTAALVAPQQEQQDHVEEQTKSGNKVDGMDSDKVNKQMHHTDDSAKTQLYEEDELHLNPKNPNGETSIDSPNGNNHESGAHAYSSDDKDSLQQQSDSVNANSIDGGQVRIGQTHMGKFAEEEERKQAIENEKDVRRKLELELEEEREENRKLKSLLDGNQYEIADLQEKVIELEKEKNGSKGETKSSEVITKDSYNPGSSYDSVHEPKKDKKLNTESKKGAHELIDLAEKLKKNLDEVGDELLTRCYKYYLLFSLPKKRADKDAAKTIAYLKLSAEMSESLQHIDLAEIGAMNKIADLLVRSTKSSAAKVGEEILYCLPAPPTNNNQRNGHHAQSSSYTHSRASANGISSASSSASSWSSSSVHRSGPPSRYPISIPVQEGSFDRVPRVAHVPHMPPPMPPMPKFPKFNGISF